jgi:hypothetical protein
MLLKRAPGSQSTILDPEASFHSQISALGSVKLALREKIENRSALVYWIGNLPSRGPSRLMLNRFKVEEMESIPRLMIYSPADHSHSAQVIEWTNEFLPDEGGVRIYLTPGAKCEKTEFSTPLPPCSPPVEDFQRRVILTPV